MPRVWFRFIAIACILAVSLSVWPGSVPAEAAANSYYVAGPSYVPPNPNFPDSTNVEVAMRFHSTWPGVITGVRFYKGVDNTGTHTGYLKNASQTVLASVTFTNETATGWQQALFSTPVPIDSGTEYIVSYTLPNAHYAYDGAFFTPNHYSIPLVGKGGGYEYDLDPNDGELAFNTSYYGVDPILQLDESTTHLSPPSDGHNFEWTHPSSVELGVRFNSDKGGAIKALRFYRAPTSGTAPRMGYLKNSSGAILASVNYGPESPFGWQTAALSTPVIISAGTDYFVTYISPDGIFAVIDAGLATPKTNGNLHSLNGVFDDDGDPATGTFTSSTHNYLVDISLVEGEEASVSLLMNIPPRLSFTVTGTPLATACNGTLPTAGSSSSGTAMNFGDILPPSSVRVAQDLNVSTNAPGGFAVFMRASGPLGGPSGTIPHLAHPNSDPDAFPANVSRLGYSVDDSNLGDGVANRFTSAADRWAGLSTTDARVAFQPSGAPSLHDSCVIFRLDAFTDVGAGHLSTQIIYTVVPIF